MNRARNRARQRANRQLNGNSLHPPQLNANVILKHRYRFISTDGTATAIGAGDLLNAAGSLVVVANTTARSLFKSVKIEEVEIWTPPASQGSAATCSILWSSSSAAAPTSLEVSDTTVSVAEPAHVRARPPARSSPSFWMDVNSDSPFTITAPSGSVIDVTLTLVVLDGAAGGTWTIASGTLGQVVYAPLDGDGDRFTPVSLTTAT